MKRVFALIVFILVLVLSPASAQPAPESLITPGVGIGPIKLGMSIAEAVSILGTPEMEQSPAGRVTYRWFKPVSSNVYRDAYSGLYVICTSRGEVTLVAAFYAPQYVTGKRLHTGVTEQTVRDAMGAPSRVTPSSRYHILEYSGIWFNIVDAPSVRGYGTVSQILVVQQSR